MKRHILFSLAFLAFASAFAQNKLSVKVLDSETNLPLSGANVQVVESQFEAISNNSGQVNFNLPPNHYTVLVNYLGYAKAEQKVDIKTGDASIIVKMVQEVNLLESVEVTALRAGADDPFAVSNISEEKIEDLNNGRDIPNLLEQTPSIVTTSDAGAGVGYTNMRIRGSDITRINVTVNGIPMNDPESHGVWFVNTPDLASSTSSMQVQRGVGTSTNGAGAFGASLNMEVGSVETEANGNIHLGMGSFNTQRATVALGTGLINKHWWASGRLSKITSDGYVDRAQSDLSSYFLSGGFKNDRTSLRAVIFGGGEETYQAWNGVDSTTYVNDRTDNSAGAIFDVNYNVIGYYDNEVDHYKQDHYQMHFNHLLNENWSLNVSGHYTYGRGYYEQYKQDQDFADYNLTPIISGNDTVNTTDLVRRKWLDNDFYGGIFNVNYKKGKLNAILGGGYNQYKGRHYGEIIWARYASSSEIRDQYYASNSNKKDGNVYLKADYALTKDFTLFADLQLRQVNYSASGTDDDAGVFAFEQNNTFFNPKIGVNYFVNKKLRTYASFAIANKEPNRTDLINAPDQNNLPKPEQLQDLEAGAVYSNENLVLEANAFYMNYINQLVLTGELNNVGAPIRANVGKSYRAGIELMGTLKFNKWLQWAANVTLSQNKNLDYNQAQDDGSVKNYGNTSIAYSPNVVASSSLNFLAFEGFKVELFTKYVGKQYLSNSDNKRHILNDYLINDVRVSYKIKLKSANSLRFYVNAQNVFDVKYASNGYTWGPYPYYYSQAGINFMGGVQFKF